MPVRLHLGDARFKLRGAWKFIGGASAGLGEELVGVG